MSWDGAFNETRSVRAFRGAEARTIAKWEADGWELVAQPPGGLVRELYFRRVKRPAAGTHADTPGLVTRKRVMAGAAALSVTAVAVIVLGGGGDETPAAAAGVTTTAPTDAATSAPAEATDTTDTTDTTDPDEVLSPYRSNEAAELVTATDPCGSVVSGFADTYAGRTLELDGNIVATKEVTAGHYDVLVHAGDFVKKPAKQTDFALQGITLDDLHLSEASGRTYVSAGDNVTLNATIGDYDTERCVLYLTPVSTDLR